MMQNIPEGITINRLVYPVDSTKVNKSGEREVQRTLSNIILLGVKQGAVIHASYVTDFLDSFQPESVFMQVAPDQPYFIRTSAQASGTYRQRWYSFLRHGKDASFYVSTQPQFTSDIILNSTQKLKSLVERNIQPTINEFELGQKVIYTRGRGLTALTHQADALFTPMLYGYQTAMQKNVKTCIGDMPMIMQRERQANAVRVAKMREIFDETVTEWGNNANFNFNPMIKYSDVFVKPRVSYMVEVLRQLAQISSDHGTVAVVDHEILPFILKAWSTELPQQIQTLPQVLKEPKYT